MSLLKERIKETVFFRRRHYFAILPWLQTSFQAGHYALWMPLSLIRPTQHVLASLGLKLTTLNLPSYLDGRRPFAICVAGHTNVSDTAIQPPPHYTMQPIQAPWQQLEGVALFSRRAVLSAPSPSHKSEGELDLSGLPASTSPRVV